MAAMKLIIKCVVWRNTITGAALKTSGFEPMQPLPSLPKDSSDLSQPFEPRAGDIAVTGSFIVSPDSAARPQGFHLLKVEFGANRLNRRENL